MSEPVDSPTPQRRQEELQSEEGRQEAQQQSQSQQHSEAQPQNYAPRMPWTTWSPWMQWKQWQQQHQHHYNLILASPFHRHPSRRPLVAQFSMRYLLIVPVLLAVLTTAVLFEHSDVNVAMLYSQCHARARLPVLSRLPGVGAPACFVVSFFEEAVTTGLSSGSGSGSTSTRALAIMATVLSFMGGLLTVSTVEAARLCNGPSLLIAYPTGPWLVFTLVGGAMVWELVITPAFFQRAKQLWGATEGDPSRQDSERACPSSPSRHLSVVAEVVAIPLAVLVGFVIPSLLMLALGSPAAIAAWLFFPLYVSALRQSIRYGIKRFYLMAGSPRSHYLEAHPPSLLAVYAVPVICSVVAHAMLLWSLLVAARADDRREMTRSTLRIVEIDTFFIGLTVLYWILVETSWRVVAVTVAAMAVLGPGGGLCVGWIYRETELGGIAWGEEEAEGEAGEGSRQGELANEANGANEATPLLR